MHRESIEDWSELLSAYYSSGPHVQTYVANLRRVLAARGVDCVTVEGRGRAYVARVRPSTLDLDIFGSRRNEAAR